MDRVQEGVQVLRSALHVPADPVCAGLIHLTWIYLDRSIWWFVICIWIHSYLRASVEISWGMLRCKKNYMFPNATHLRLTEHLQTVLTDELQQLAVREAEELVFFGHLGTQQYRERHTDDWLCTFQSLFFPRVAIALCAPPRWSVCWCTLDSAGAAPCSRSPRQSGRCRWH